MFEIKLYTEEWKDAWDAFVLQSKNGTFLHLRNYMDYHADRFCDHSLLFLRDNKIYAVLPANRREETLYSHQGLTYGGLITGNDATAVHVIEIFRMMNDYLREKKIHHIVYKAIPSIYHRLPAEEDLYAIHVTCNYRLSERDISTTLIPLHQLRWKKDRRHGVKKALQNGLRVCESNDFESFWKVLSNNLLNKHKVLPVHTLEEMMMLRNRFPQNIFLFTAQNDNTLFGGCVVYVVNEQVVHTQYISATPEGKQLGAIDLIIYHLTNNVFNKHTYFDFGKSTEQHSKQLNEKLIYQKEGFGGRAICYDTYEWFI